MAKAPSTLIPFLQQERAAGIGAGEAIASAVLSAFPSSSVPASSTCEGALSLSALLEQGLCFNWLQSQALSVGTEKKKKSPPTLTYLITCQGLLGCLLGSGLPSLGKRDNVLLLKHNLVRLPLNGILKLPMCGRPAQAVLYLGWMQLPLPWFLSSKVQPFPSAMNANSSSSWGKEVSS